MKVVPNTADAEPRVTPQEAASFTANVVKDAHEHSYALANPPSHAKEVSVGDVENMSMQGNTSSGESQFPQHKKARLAADLVSDDNILSSSPDLHHKQPRSREQQENDDIEGSGDSSGEDSLELEHSNLYGMKFLMWFEIGI
jgi:hypothetical protein